MDGSSENGREGIQRVSHQSALGVRSHLLTSVVAGERVPVVELIVRQPSLALQLERFLHRFSPLPAVTSTGSSLILHHAPALASGEDISDHRQSLHNMCRALVPLRQPIPLPYSHQGSQTQPPAPLSPPLNLKQHTVSHSKKELSASPRPLLSQPEEREQLVQESDDELDMPAEGEAPCSDCQSLNNSSHSSSDYQGPPRKMARLDREEEREALSEAADDGSSTADQAVPGSNCAEGHPLAASLSPCRQGGGGGGERGGGGGGSEVYICGDPQVVPSAERDEAGPLPTLYEQEPPKLRPPPTSWEERDSAVESGDEWPRPSSALRPAHCWSCRRRGCLHSEETASSVQLNLSRPRLRLGLSKCQRLQPLHTSLSSREE